MAFRLPFFLGLLWCLQGCSGDGVKAKLIVYKPKVYFTEEVKMGSRINLSKRLGDTLSLKKGNVEKTFALSYDKKSRVNEIVELGKGLHFSGTASKYKDLIFLNEERDSVFQVYAFTIENDEITGFTNLLAQQKRLDQLVKEGLHEGMFEETSNGMYLLDPSKKRLLTLYSSILMEGETWVINQKVD